MTTTNTLLNTLTATVTSAPSKAAAIWAIHDVLAERNLDTGPTALSKMYTHITGVPMRPQHARNVIVQGRPKGSTRKQVDLQAILNGLK